MSWLARRDRADLQATPMHSGMAQPQVQHRQAHGELTQDEQDLRADILAGMIAHKGGEQQIGTAERILAEIISSDVALLVTFN
jgi:hypothetical protein